jgi:DNA-binding NtrC family response regulator
MDLDVIEAGKEKGETGKSVPQMEDAQPYERPFSRLRILVAAADIDARTGISELLQEYSIKTLCVRAAEEVRAALSKERFAACFSGFWLMDGTYRDVFRHLRRQALSAPMVLICGPTCPTEYKDYLVSLKIRAFDFICHPYRKSDLERVLQPLTGVQTAPVPRQARFEEAYAWSVNGGQRHPVKA